MLRTISAAPSPVEQAGPSVTRSGPSRFDRSGKSDNDNDFSHALRGAHDENSDTDSGRDKSSPSTPSNTSANRQDRKEEAPKKRNAKDDDTNEQSAKAAVPAPTQVQPKDSPLAALLSFISYQGPAPTEDPKPKPQPSATGPAVDTSIASPMPTATVPAVADAAAFPIEVKPADVKTGDVKAAVATNGRTQDRIQSMTVPLDYYPILQTGIGWGSAAAAVATSTGAANATSPSAAGAVTADSKADPLVINAPPASEAVEPSLSPKNTAFAIRLTTDTQQTAKTSDSGTAPAQRFTLNSPSIAALDQATKQDGKSQSNDSSSGQNNPFGAAYTESTSASRFTPDKPSFTESTSTTATAAADETAAKPVSDPLRNILLQLKSDDNRRIDVRLVERAGELHVAVKSADPVLAERLQESMPELTSRLETEHFTHEVWMPKLSEAQKSESGSNSNDNSAGTDGRSGQQFNGEAGRRQGGQSQSRPDWVDLLENQIG